LNQIKFHKFHGTGNDFILVDNRNLLFQPTQKQVAFLCHRRFGIGADGLILLEKDNEYDFKMKYFNSDGNESSMCGNGGRCIVAFASKLDIIKEHSTFKAIDGIHKGEILKNAGNIWDVKLKMNDVDLVEQVSNIEYTVDSGSPHFIRWIEKIGTIDVVKEGSAIRNSDHYKVPGINVNFVEQNNSALSIRTYERGVEDETLSCGTGCVAAAIASEFNSSDGVFNKTLHTMGGDLMVSFKKTENKYTDVHLTGNAIMVYEGHLNLNTND